jgi:hypothetical protein
MLQNLEDLTGGALVVMKWILSKYMAISHNKKKKTNLSEKDQSCH